MQDSEKLVRNLKVILSYDGSEFAGWQVQPGRATVQGTLSCAIGRLTGENVLPQGSGRTDAGVHALAQVASFWTASPIPIENWKVALNDLLPAAIRVFEVSEAAADFHARKSARSKTYCYRIHRGAVCPPFLARYIWHYPYPLDEEAMADAAVAVVGSHDFTSFAAADPERAERMQGSAHDGGREAAPAGGATAPVATAPASTVPGNVREIFSSRWAREGDELVYTVHGNGFLHHMVRNLVGTFVLVGKGTVRRNDFERILAARERSAAGPTAPPNGLFLVRVEY
jgi:tRNA pseudouridine38-40 synthase